MVGGIKADRIGQLPDSRNPEMKAQTIASALLLVFLVANVAANKVTTCHSCEGANCQRVSLAKTASCVDSLDYCVTIYDEG